ncbi:MAG TPA: fructosamine kinase family protein [Solirubrobacteraceae bacterium]|nr:fructosamine kinase family protein [Solirubrobacteraceae bacterium]
MAEAAARALGRPLAGARRVAGGDINDAWLVELDDGRRAFVKTRADARPGEYATEASGLRWLGEVEGGLAVPEVLAVHDADDGAPAGAGSSGGAETPPLLALAWLDEGRLDAAGEEELGRGLARVHAAGAPAFGAPPPGAPDGLLRLGAVELPAATGADWPAFYAEHRLAPLLRAAADRGALSPGGAAAIDAVIARLPELAGPPEPPARLHGDLWSGNVLAGRDGRPRLIDSAAYGGHREIDLAMLQLFGAPSPRTLAAYAEVHPLAEGHERRVPLWQLLPLLVHAILFGGGYGASAVRAAQRAAR